MVKVPNASYFGTNDALTRNVSGKLQHI